MMKSLGNLGTWGTTPAPIYLYDSARTMGSDDAINMSYNLTWTFLVDSGFKYLVRLHLCEISHEVTGVNQRVFTVYINNQTVEDSLDVIALAGAPLVAIYRDYTIVVPEGIGGKQKLWLALHPNPESSPKFENAILNGVEIMKLSDENNNLAPYFEPRFGKRKKIRVSVVLEAVLASSSYVNTDVKGTLGYLDPEYYRSRKLSSKSDVYSFGVVLLEVLCARPVVVEEEEYKVSLAEWALRCHGSGNFGCIIDPLLRGKIAPGSLITFMEITVKCLADRRTQRPSIRCATQSGIVIARTREHRCHGGFGRSLLTPNVYNGNLK
ncbi:hypothetical protein GH714_029394 [Hevea brasiliensis]|uniref:Protein kinase domain-containing protein n=1 Tax=Hevea brasiliensis TaxID=3981 RepID=A0A6A6NJR7_HEVBR|nr:hypothetical protein GH714_029394 [Hevea brasiliensis]